MLLADVFTIAETQASRVAEQYNQQQEEEQQAVLILVETSAVTEYYNKQQKEEQQALAALVFKVSAETTHMSDPPFN